MSTPALKSPIAPDVVGVLPSGAVRASCASALPEVIYYADAVAMALWSVTRPGWRAHGALADRAFSWVMAQQRPDGSFPQFSRGDYYVLYDRNEYPRYLAMTPHHLGGAGARAGTGDLVRRLRGPAVVDAARRPSAHSPPGRRSPRSVATLRAHA